MPLTQQSLQPKSCQLAVWEITEEVVELSQPLHLNTQQQAELAIRQTINGKKGYLAVRNALNSLGQNLAELTVAADGAPELPEKFCSMSHSLQYAVVGVANRPVGVDIEQHRPQIERIAKKFLHQEEAKQVPEHHKIEWLTRLWTAKEALYKVMRQPGLSFAEQILVAPFSLDQQSGSARVFTQEGKHDFQLEFFTFDQHQLTLAHPIAT